MRKEGVARRAGLKGLATGKLLMLYFGLSNERSVRKNDLCDELVVRGVSPVMLTDAIEGLLYVVGSAADNRMPEIDDQ